MNVLALKPDVDSRYDNNSIASHNGGKVRAINITSGYEIYDILKNEDYNVIAVDEAFMIIDIDEVLIDLYKTGKSIIISSIQLDSNEKPFMPTLHSAFDDAVHAREGATPRESIEVRAICFYD